jgi:hypothetical protein
VEQTSPTLFSDRRTSRPSRREVYPPVGEGRKGLPEETEMKKWWERRIKAEVSTENGDILLTIHSPVINSGSWVWVLGKFWFVVIQTY